MDIVGFPIPEWAVPAIDGSTLIAIVWLAWKLQGILQNFRSQILKNTAEIVRIEQRLDDELDERDKTIQKIEGRLRHGDARFDDHVQRLRAVEVRLEERV